MVLPRNVMTPPFWRHAGTAAEPARPRLRRGYGRLREDAEHVQPGEPVASGREFRGAAGQVPDPRFNRGRKRAWPFADPRQTAARVAGVPARARQPRGVD